MIIGKAKKQKLPTGLALTIHAESDNEQITRILIQKEFATDLDADAWYEDKKESITNCLKELEAICKD